MRSLWRGRRRRIRSWWWRKSLKNKCILQAPLYGASQSCTSIESTEEMYLKLHRQQWCNRSKTLKDVTKFLSPAITGWYQLQLLDRLMLSIDIAGIGYGLYLQQYKGKHSRMELLPFKAGFSWEQFGVFHICRQLSRPLAVLCEQLQRSPGCSWQHRRGTSPRPKSQHNFFDWLFQCSQIDQCFYRIRV